MKLDLSGIIRRDGREQTATVTAGDCTLHIAGDRQCVRGFEPFPLTIANVGGKRLVVKGESTATVVLPCDRCLKAVTLSIPIAIDAVYGLDGGAAVNDADDPDEALSDNILDIDVLLSDVLLCNLPSKVLCQRNCKGLCPHCGQDLNLAECGCNRETLDPRMAKVLDLFSEFKEV